VAFASFPSSVAKVANTGCPVTLFILKNKPNFRPIWPKNQDLWKKQTQFKPNQTQFLAFPQYTVRTLVLSEAEGTQYENQVSRIQHCSTRVDYNEIQ